MAYLTLNGLGIYQFIGDQTSSCRELILHSAGDPSADRMNLPSLRTLKQNRAADYLAAQWKTETIIFAGAAGTPQSQESPAGKH